MKRRECADADAGGEPGDRLRKGFAELAAVQEKVRGDEARADSEKRCAPPRADRPEQHEQGVELHLYGNGPQHADAFDQGKVAPEIFGRDGLVRERRSLSPKLCNDCKRRHDDDEIERRNARDAAHGEACDVGGTEALRQVEGRHQIAAQHEEQHDAKLAAALPEQAAPEIDLIGNVRSNDDQRGETAKSVEFRAVCIVHPARARASGMANRMQRSCAEKSSAGIGSSTTQPPAMPVKPAATFCERQESVAPQRTQTLRAQAGT
jgi:hypothetical protein